jgi:outer membrane protein insertion porin family
MSLGYNLWWREFDNSNFNTASYSTTSAAAQMVAGLPITENDTVTGLFGIDRNQIFAYPGSSPQEFVDYIDALDTRTFHAWRTELGWARDTRNQYFSPTRGMYQRVSAEITLPGSTVQYYKLNYQFSKYWPLTRYMVLNTRAELGYGDSYGSPTTRDSYCLQPLPPPRDTDGDGKPDVQDPRPPSSDPCLPTSPDYHPISPPLVADGLPFFENFYAGGTNSVRGFRDNTLGPRGTALGSTLQQPLGGAVKTIGSLELIFPTLLDTPSARVSAFVDFGNVYRNADEFNIDEIRASAGVALLWRAPVGPISISYAIPLKSEPDDEIERLQFTFGGSF